MAERTFLIQRYCSDNWPQVRGLRPFIVTGPSFEAWVIPDSLERTGRHVLRRELRELITGIFPGEGFQPGHHFRAAVAESLLRENVLSALWSIDSVECLSVESRWESSITQVSRELPISQGISMAAAIDELLSGMPTPAMAREYLSEDGLGLEATSIPTAV
jgi:hypothetical protein